jgi:hypothetical protein
MTNAMHSSKTDDHRTPADVIERVHRVLGEIDLDPASSPHANRVVCAAEIFTKEDDGLAQKWFGRVFLNPPGNGPGASREWWRKLQAEWLAGRVTEGIFLAFTMQILQNAQIEQPAGSLLPTDLPFCIPSKRISFYTQERIECTHSDSREPRPAPEDEDPGLLVYCAVCEDFIEPGAKKSNASRWYKVNKRGEGLDKGDQPTHANTLVYLPRTHTPIGAARSRAAVWRDESVAHFKKVFSDFGAVIVPR